MGTKKQHADVPELQLVTEEDLDDDCFFESLDRVSSGVSIDFDVPSSSSDGDYDDGRCSFASAVAPPSRRISHSDDDEDDDDEEAPAYDYGIWMAEPISITERRRLLLQGMGFSSRKDMAAPEPPLGRSHRRHGSISLKHSLSRLSLRTAPIPIPIPIPIPVPAPVPAPAPAPVPAPAPLPAKAGRQLPSPSLTRSRSDTHAILRPPAILRRTLSAPPSLRLESSCRGAEAVDSPPEEDDEGACRIKNLDTGKEFVVSEEAKDGTWDVQSGSKLTMDEFERFIGYSPVVKELLMRRVTGSKKGEDSNTTSSTKNSSNKSSGSRRKGGWLKNIKFVASSMTGLLSEKERRSGGGGGIGTGSGGNEWMKVRQHGKSHKELTGLYMCQQIPAHQGSIWCIKFSPDSLYLASAGEDRAVRVWQVIESENFSPESLLGQDHSRTSSSLPPLPPQAPNGSKVKISSNGSRRVSSVPDYIVTPKTVFSLSEKPLCSLEGHLDDVLDLSWSKSQPQHLLSSSMDKTVRLWDVESKACIKLFAHNDYVTCIQFNPVDDRYFISGSLDEKVRIWNIPNRQVVDWTDLHEMVTAVCYTPDGQGALVGSHKGTCRFYNTSDCKLNQESQIDIRSKKKKSQAKKITGFQYAPDNTSEVLITSADSQIRIFDGTDMINKFRGFRNTSSQISASFTTDGKFVVCASEDSHVYVWKRSNAGSGGKSKGLTTTRSHEHFFCKDVSVAIPWPSAGSICTPPSYSGSHSPLLGSPDRQQSASAVEDNFPSSRSHHPPFSEKSSPERISPPSPESAISSPSIMSPSPSQRDDAISSASVSGSSSLSSWRWYSGGSGRSNGLAANAWGLVVVTAGLGGDIKVYQNFGLPLRLSRQANLF